MESGDSIDGLGGFSVYGMIERADTAHRSDMLPLGLAPGARVRKPIEVGQTLTYSDVELDDTSMIVHLRRLQELELGYHHGG